MRALVNRKKGLDELGKTSVVSENLQKRLVGKRLKSFFEINVKVVQSFVLIGFRFNILDVICHAMKIQSAVLCRVIKFVKKTLRNKLGGKVRQN